MEDVLIGRQTRGAPIVVVVPAATLTPILTRNAFRLSLLIATANGTDCTVSPFGADATAAIGIPVRQTLPPLERDLLSGHGDVTEPWTAFSTAGCTLTIIEGTMNREK